MKGLIHKCDCTCLLALVQNKCKLAIIEDNLWKCLAINTSNAEIYKVLNNILNGHFLSQNNCTDICTVGAKIIVSKTSGVSTNQGRDSKLYQ